MMTEVVELPVDDWTRAPAAPLQASAAHALEQGHLLLLPKLRFELTPDELALMRPRVAAGAKNVSFDPSTGVLRGSDADAAEQIVLQRMMSRFGQSTRALLAGLLPRYQGGLLQARTSFRPVEIDQRQTSWRKDDTRLHVDSFPSSPTQGRRILRVFANVNPAGVPRVWRVGERFEAVAARFRAVLTPQRPGVAALLQALHVTKSRRSDYDHCMLRLHDAMKADLGYQSQVQQRRLALAAGSVWMVYTDQASHAAMSGQYALEQTYHLPVESMHDPSTSPLQVLQRLLGRRLV
jgi:hypothetical protein